ncbi:hypothetical protein BLA29_008078, partial [Euroglyphus maynei]
SDPDKCLVKKVQNAIRFINEQLKLGEQSRLVCLKKSFQDQNKKDILANNDDLIHQLCLQFKENPRKFLPTLTMDKERLLIVLVTNDQNLQNKAFVHQMNSCSLNELVQKYYEADQIGNMHVKANLTAKPDRVETDISASSFRSPSKRFRKNNQQNITKELPLKKHLTTLSKKMDTPPPSPMDFNTNANSSKELDCKYALESRLAEFIISKFKEIFGQDLWQSILGNYSPATATLVDSLRKFKNNWMGVFSDFFDRDQKVIRLVDEMLQSKNNRNQENCEQLLQMIELAFERKIDFRENE